MVYMYICVTRPPDSVHLCDSKLGLVCACVFCFGNFFNLVYMCKCFVMPLLVLFLGLDLPINLIFKTLISCL